MEAVGVDISGSHVSWAAIAINWKVKVLMCQGELDGHIFKHHMSCYELDICGQLFYVCFWSPTSSILLRHIHTSMNFLQIDVILYQSR